MDPFDDLEELPEVKPFPKSLKIILAVFLIVLMLSFLIPQEVTQSLAASNRIQNDEIPLQNAKIVFTNDIYEKLKVFYFQNQLTEIAMCLTGEIKDGNYIVTDFYAPKIFFKTPITVASQRCNQETIIMMHTHPFNDCLLSSQDIASYEAYKNVNTKAIIGVMCSADRFAFYGN